MNIHNKENISQIPSQQLSVKVIVIKFGKLLLCKYSGNNIAQLAEQGKWALLEVLMNVNENLSSAIFRDVLKKSGWMTKNIRLFQIKISSNKSDESEQMSEIVLIVDGIKQTLPPDGKIQGLRWFPLNDLPKPEGIATEHAEIIYALADLLHRGKTLDLEHLPPVFTLKGLKKNNFFQLLS